MPPLFRKLLVANRGEIAVRVMRTCRELGIATVAVYSEADRGARHVREADEAVPIGPAQALRSYLSIDALLKAARETGAEAIHPGYGFLSQNGDFADAVEGAGLVFVGPPGAVHRLMGDKQAARRRMAAAGVPVLPGFDDDDQRDARLVSEAERIGWPVLLKPARGGGGKGMRVVWSASEIEAALAASRREARAAFGSDTLLVERFVERSRHVEVQVVADAHGARRPPRRARVLDPAPPSEGGRGDAEPGARRATCAASCATRGSRRRARRATAARGPSSS